MFQMISSDISSSGEVFFLCKLKGDFCLMDLKYGRGSVGDFFFSRFPLVCSLVSGHCREVASALKLFLPGVFIGWDQKLFICRL